MERKLCSGSLIVMKTVAHSVIEEVRGISEKIATFEIVTKDIYKQLKKFGTMRL